MTTNQPEKDLDAQVHEALLQAIKTAANQSRTATSYTIAESYASTARQLAEARAWLLQPRHGS